MSAHDIITIGWRDQPDGRGTYDILQTCGGTILLLCWSSVCPNLPSAKSGRFSGLGGKLQLFLLAILGPDFIFMLALGQLNVAWKAKKAFHGDEHFSWTLRHCFFTNMGGIHVQFPDRAAAQLDSFPVDCEQLLFLVRRGYVDMPDLSEDEIDERNKSDNLGRAIAIIQSLWFTVNAFGRIAQGLHITTLELTTLAFVFLMSACAICWWKKPMDVTRPIIIYANTDLPAVLQEAGAPAVLHGRTPLSFYSRHEWFMSQFWHNYIQILRKARLVPSKRTKPTEYDHFASIDFPETDFKWEFCGGPLVILYSCIFMAAWNFHFPTDMEKTLWRTASIACLAFGLLGSALVWVLHNASRFRRMASKALHMGRSKEKAAPQTSDEERQQEQEGANPRSRSSRLSAAMRRVSNRFGWMRNLSPDQDPALTVPVRLWITTTLLCVVYCVSRLYILAEDLASLRALPESAYMSVDWGQYAPIL